MVPEAPLRQTPHGLVPEGDGWFVVNARAARWRESAELGAWVPFEGEARFPRLGINLGVLEPGQPSCMYHREDEQEDFLVLAGECLLLVEGEERRLGAWDFFHCPPGTDHVFVGAGKGPCLILAVGTRADGAIVYPESDLARRHGAGVERETTEPAEAYAPFSPPHDTSCRKGWLPETR